MVWDLNKAVQSLANKLLGNSSGHEEVFTVERNVVAFNLSKYVVKHLKAALFSKGNKKKQITQG